MLSGPMPHVSAGVFFDSPAAEITLREALADRRLSRLTPHVSAGGMAAAIAYCKSSPTPDLLVLETDADCAGIMAGLDHLEPVCDENTKVIVIGRANDIGLYRNMIARGVSEYLVGPIDRSHAIAAILGLYQNGAATRTGRICAFMGAKGGVGSSTIAQNVAWRIGHDRSGPVMLADMDLQFGTAALNLNLSPSVGISEQTRDPDRLDPALLERTLLQSGSFLHVLPASGRMELIEQPDLVAVEKLLELSRNMFPVVILDLPHLQSPWMKAVLSSVDDLVIVAAPDLANLRNAKCLFDILRALRPTDAAPKLVLNQVGITRRAGIPSAEFAGALGVDLGVQIGFDPQTFSKAANKGQLIAETAPRSAAGKAIAALAEGIDPRRSADDAHSRRKRHWFQMNWRSGG